MLTVAAPRAYVPTARRFDVWDKMRREADELNTTVCGMTKNGRRNARLEARQSITHNYLLLSIIIVIAIVVVIIIIIIIIIVVVVIIIIITIIVIIVDVVVSS